MDETGTMLSHLNSVKVLIARSDGAKHGSVPLKREMVTAIGSISADGRVLYPLIIWLAASHQSAWTTHATHGWHYAYSPKGYTDKAISLNWIKHVVYPQTRGVANGRPRVLINDGFSSHEFPEILEFCRDQAIVLCRLPSHTSHKTQPCDVGVFGPLKAADRDEVERTYGGGLGVVDKRHFTLLCDRARQKAMTRRNVLSPWSRAGHSPFNRSKVLRHIAPAEPECLTPTIANQRDTQHYLKTPVSPTAFNTLLNQCSKGPDGCEMERQRSREKIEHGVQQMCARNALLENENLALRQQNNEKRTRESTDNRVSVQARIMSYEAIAEDKRKRDTSSKVRKPSDDQSALKRQKRYRNESLRRFRMSLKKQVEQEIRDKGLKAFCSVFRVEQCSRCPVEGLPTVQFRLNLCVSLC